MNLGSYTTLARYRTKEYGPRGFSTMRACFPSADFLLPPQRVAIWKALPRRGSATTQTVTKLDEFAASFDVAMKSNELTSIIAKVEPIGPKGYVTELSLLENRFQFKRHIEELLNVPLLENRCRRIEEHDGT